MESRLRWSGARDSGWFGWGAGWWREGEGWGVREFQQAAGKWEKLCLVTPELGVSDAQKKCQ